MPRWAIFLAWFGIWGTMLGAGPTARTKLYADESKAKDAELFESQESAEDKNKPVTEESVPAPEGDTESLLEKIDIAGQVFNDSESTPRELATQAFLIKKAAEKVVADSAASQGQKELALMYAITYLNAASQFDPQLFRAHFNALIDRVIKEFAGTKPASLAEAYRVMYDRIDKLEPDTDLLPILTDYQQRYPQSDFSPQLFERYADRLAMENRTEEAMAALRKALATFENNANAAKRFTLLLNTYKRQLEMLGKPMTLSGPTVAGGLFDIQGLRGNVVMLIFWSEGSPFSQVEMANALKVYQKYRFQGLDVVGINVTDDKDAIIGVVKQRKLPWQQVFVEDPAKRGPSNPIVAKYLVIRLPTIIVIDREGKIAAVGIRGEKTMGEVCANLLKPKESEAAASTDGATTKTDEPAKP